MKIESTIMVEEAFLPTKRCRKERTRRYKLPYEVEIRELTEDQAPIAFIINEHFWNDNGKDYCDHVIRLVDGKLYEGILFSSVQCGGEGFMPIDHLRYILNRDNRYSYDSPEYDEEVSVHVSDDMEAAKNSMDEKASNYFILDGCVWEVCGEPRYVVNTFGLGHNHGGTGMFVEQYYNCNISGKNYFTALQREKAIKYADAVAAARGDTNDVGKFDEMTDMITVLIPEAVQCKPNEEAGEGDPFMNDIEGLIEASDSAVEAGILTVFATMKSIL